MSSLVATPKLRTTSSMNNLAEEEEKTVATNITATTYTGRDSQEIRSRLLSRLGIYDAPSGMNSPQPMTAAQHRRVRILRGMGVGYTMFKSPPDGSATRKPLDGVVPSKEPLKSDYVEEDQTDDNKDNNTNNNNSNNTRRKQI
mmetsp:Transcript_4789/g.8888  ORF Transcript_4789/g.8888 Transcript_4789/m.8888 type:complete len:143 (-) Transcript_4789:247-675(-)